MDLNTAMRFVMVRARSEAVALKAEEMYPEHLFLALLKLSEATAEEIAPTSRHKQQLNDDIAGVDILLKKANIKSDTGRLKLRKILQGESSSETDKSGVEVILSLAAKSADDNIITATNVLTVMLTKPTPIIKAAFHVKEKEEKKADKSNPKPAKANPGEMGIAWLPQLTQRIRNMRYTLLEKVYGQDHVVHAFAEGMFSAEVLAAADESRKRPRAIFVFAGPPGVGKTFLAEQAAELLSIPFGRFDMSSYADHQAQMNLIGFAPSYKDAKPGLLTGFVKENPHSILLFDEIEKAHLNTIHLFLQILDAGILHDDFLDETVPFKDTIIIFTSNAGRQLYQGDAKANAAGLSRQVILNALETDKHPQTGKPFFPGAICSRLATGFPMMFNHLKAYDLEKISAREFMRFGELFERQYGIKVSADNLLASTLLFAEGGQADARTLRAQTELFFKNEIFKLCRLWGDNFEDVLKSLKFIHFQVETANLSDEVKHLFENPEKPEILIFSDNHLPEDTKQQMPGLKVHMTDDVEQALLILGKSDVNFVLLELCNDSHRSGDVMETLLWGEEPAVEEKTIYIFDNVPMAASSLHKSRTFFKTLRERLPDMPVFLLESEQFKIDNELLTAFVRAGARGKLVLPQGNLGVLADEIKLIAMQAYLQDTAANLSAQSKILSFETAPKLSENKTKATIRLRELAIRRAVSAADTGGILDEVEKPQVRFNDVIGATDAKDELQFFINFLKNPKKFSALGLKPPKGVLLYGPPGTGKTLLAKAMAGESNVAFIAAVASAFVTKYQGSGPEAVRDLFNRARRYAPAIVFIDEIDAVGRARGKAGSAHGEEMALNALLTEMDGFSVDPKRPVFVLAATNFDIEEGKGGMGVIDAALARRFDRKILVDLPNKNDRRKYLGMMLRKREKNEVSDAMMDRLAGRSAGFSLANLESVIELAARTAAKKNQSLNDELLEEAFELSSHGEKKDWGRQYLERVARHEAGHAYLCFLAGATPSYLTIVARGGHGGYMEHADTENSPLKTREELLGRIRTSLGGRAAEIAYYGDEDGISSGASGDLQSATRIARAMICAYGMDETIGMAVLSEEEATRGPMAEKITQRISEIISRELAYTIQVISKGKHKIDDLVEQLLEKNKLNKEEMEEILG
ncbi:MAG: AAA family ATPase [Prolixibacteraceae bacterium]|nr:AAA family ATPase [Prolixibacteraceae bacterium]